MDSEQFIPQAAAIPYRRNGDCEVLLIRRIPDGIWSIPKGLIDPGHTARQTAEIETWEEAGVEGEVSVRPLGSYQYPKFGGICEVQVFTLHVTKVHERFPEQRIRERVWLSSDKAAELVHREPLKRMICELSKTFA